MKSELKRKPPTPVRLNAIEERILRGMMVEGEGISSALKRLSGIQQIYEGVKMGVNFFVTEKRGIAIKDATTCTAKLAVDALEKGCSVYGFTLGQFSVSDLIFEVLDKIGAAHVIISTWTASAAKIDEAFDLFDSGDMLSCRFLLDPGFKSRQPKFASHLVSRFGNGSIRTISNHAKFVVLRNDDWDVVIKTSMNLNNNPRLENFELCEGKELAEYITGFVDHIFMISDPDENFELAGYGGLNKKAIQVTEDDILNGI